MDGAPTNMVQLALTDSHFISEARQKITRSESFRRARVFPTKSTHLRGNLLFCKTTIGETLTHLREEILFCKTPNRGLDASSSSLLLFLSHRLPSSWRKRRRVLKRCTFREWPRSQNFGPAKRRTFQDGYQTLVFLYIYIYLYALVASNLKVGSQRKFNKKLP